jgi:hypothetical protein
MSLAAAFAPVFIQVGLTFVLLFSAGITRVRLVRQGVVKAADVALRQANWPEKATQLINAYQNQLELPVLFYLLMVAAFFSGHMTMTLAVLSWLFVGARLLHALVHVTTNDMRRRFFLFLAGALILLAMWLVFLVEVLFGSA